jgi:scyllo-inositol 2-dehydrogenase (NAD+)
VKETVREPVRCAVLGLGRLGYWHAENLATRIEGAKLVHVVASRKERAKEVAGTLGVEVWSDSPDLVMQDPNIDAVIICTPTSTHAELIEMAARCGKQIFVEKPLTIDWEEAKKIIRVLEDARVVCQVGFMRRFDPAYQEAKRLIEAGEIGIPLSFKAVSRDPGSPPPEYIQNSGGIFLDMAIHDFDLARFLLASEVTSVSAYGNVLKHEFMREAGDVDQSITYLTFHSGAVGDIETSRNSAYGYDIRAEVIGTEGVLRIGTLRHHEVTIVSPHGAVHDIVPHFPERFQQAFLNEMTHFIDSIRRNQRPAVTEQDGLIALQIAMAAKQSYLTKERVELASIS